VESDVSKTPEQLPDKSNAAVCDADRREASRGHQGAHLHHDDHCLPPPAPGRNPCEPRVVSAEATRKYRPLAPYFYGTRMSQRRAQCRVKVVGLQCRSTVESLVQVAFAGGGAARTAPCQWQPD
jgi:hypothetical protein